MVVRTLRQHNLSSRLNWDEYKAEPSLSPNGLANLWQEEPISVKSAMANGILLDNGVYADKVKAQIKSTRGVML